MKIYVLRERDSGNEEVLLSAHLSLEKAQARKSALVEEWVTAILADDPKDTGVTIDDKDWLIKDTADTIVIEEIELEA